MNIMNVLIVDDDILIRNWLSILLKQINDFDINILEASDGIEALKVCDSNIVDFVFTDIKMPRLNGLQLIEKLRINYPGIKTVVLSSYSDFKYVKTALKLGSLDYILKPEMKIEDLVSVLKKVSTLDVNNHDDTDISQQVCENYNKRNILFKQFISGETDEDTFFSNVTLQKKKNICISILKLHQSIGEQDAYNVIKICDNTLASEKLSGDTFFTADNYFVMLYNSNMELPEYRKNEYEKMAVIISGLIEKNLNFNISYNMYTISPNECDLVHIFEESYKFVLTREYYPLAPGGLKLKLIDCETSHKLLQDLRKYIETQKYEDALNLFEESIKGFHEGYYFPKHIKALAVYIVTMFYNNNNFYANDIISIQKYHKYIEKISSATTSTGMSNEIKEFITVYRSTVGNNVKNISPQIHKALDYINEHYMEKLTLEQVASCAYLSKTYFSQLFKKQLNISFGVYLENIRITKAINLLRNTSTPLSEIAEKCGFASQNYFTKIFKQKVGISPLKYRKN